MSRPATHKQESHLIGKSIYPLVARVRVSPFHPNFDFERLEESPISARSRSGTEHVDPSKLLPSRPHRALHFEPPPVPALENSLQSYTTNMRGCFFSGNVGAGAPLTIATSIS